MQLHSITLCYVTFTCQICCQIQISTLPCQMLPKTLEKSHVVESIQDFLIRLGIKPLRRLLEIIIFSPNNDLGRLTKIMNNLLKDCKIHTFKVILTVQFVWVSRISITNWIDKCLKGATIMAIWVVKIFREHYENRFTVGPR